MNRDEFIFENIKSTNKLINLNEHIIIDWTSTPKIIDEYSQANRKSKIVRVDKEKNWWLSRAYNFGFHLANSEYILKLDVDTTINFDEINKLDLEGINYLNFTIDKNGYGNFIVRKEILNEINGFNEYIFDWGYDDKDLHTRILNYLGEDLEPIDGTKYIKVIPHVDSLRVNVNSKAKNKLPDSLMLASHKKNRYIASILNWDKKFNREYSLTSKGTYEIEHFYSLRDLPIKNQLEAKAIFISTFLNEYFGKGGFIKLKPLIKIIPFFFFRLFTREGLYPKK